MLLLDQTMVHVQVELPGTVILEDIGSHPMLIKIIFCWFQIHKIPVNDLSWFLAER